MNGWIATGIWLRESRGGYGYVAHVPCREVKRGAKKVLIEAPLIRGGYKRAWINAANYRPFDASSSTPINTEKE